MVRKAILVISSLVLGVVVPARFAHAEGASLTAADVLRVPEVAYDTFAETAAEHLPHFYGYKVWKDAGAAHVKIYTNENGEILEFIFLCKKTEKTADVECSRQ